jgi:hypothetical protein
MGRPPFVVALLRNDNAGACVGPAYRANTFRPRFQILDSQSARPQSGTARCAVSQCRDRFLAGFAQMNFFAPNCRMAKLCRLEGSGGRLGRGRTLSWHRQRQHRALRHRSTMAQARSPVLAPQSSPQGRSNYSRRGWCKGRFRPSLPAERLAAASELRALFRNPRLRGQSRIVARLIILP